MAEPAKTPLYWLKYHSNSMRSSDGGSDDDNNDAAIAGIAATHAAAEVHMQEETEHDTEVVSQDDGEEKTNAEFAY